MIQNDEQNYSVNQTNDQNVAFDASYIGELLTMTKSKMEERRKKTEIRRLSWLTGVPFLLVFLFTMFWKTIFFAVVDLLSISRQSVADFFSSSVNQDLLSVIISSFIFIVFFSPAIKISKRRASDVLSFKKPEKGTVLPLVLIGFSFCMFANILNNQFAAFFESFGTKYSVGSSRPEISVLSFVMSVISTAIIPGLVEEYACRGVIMGILLPYGEGFALLSTAIIFGVMHGNFEQMPFAFLVGIILGYIRIKSGSLWPCILVHSLNNLFSVLVQFAGFYISVQERNVLQLGLLVLSFIVGLVATFVFTKNESALRLDKKVTYIKEKDKYKWFFTSPVMIVALLGHFGMSFKYFS